MTATLAAVITGCPNNLVSPGRAKKVVVWTIMDTDPINPRTRYELPDGDDYKKNLETIIMAVELMNWSSEDKMGTS